MEILISILIALILAFWTSKLKIDIEYLNKPPKSLKIKFDVKLSLYLFGLIKIFEISLKEDGIYFLFFKIPYHIAKIDKNNIKVLKGIPILDLSKILNLKLSQFHFDLKLGSEDTILTVFSVFAISTFLSIVSAKNAKQINFKRYYYKVTPIYNTNTLSFKISSIISIKISNIVKAFIFAQKHTKIKKEYNIHIRRVPIKI